MVDVFRGYVRTQNKRCVQKFGNGEPLLSIKEAAALPEFAGVLNGNFTVVDVDDGEQAAITLRVVLAEKLNTRVYRTTRGLHFVFAASNSVAKNCTRKMCALGLELDIRYGQNAYVLLKQNGTMREIVREFDEGHPLAVVPKWLAPCKSARCFMGMSEGDGRNSALFSYICTLTHCGFTKEETRETMRLINQYIFSQPLDASELAQVLRDEAFAFPTPLSQAPNMGGKATYGVRLAEYHPENNARYAWTDIGASRLFADYCKSVARFVPERKLWYCYDGRRWVPDIGNLKAMELCKSLADALLAYAVTIPDEHQRSTYIDYSRKWQTRRNRETILKDAQGIDPIPMAEFDRDPFVFNCANGTLFLHDMVFKPHNSDDKLTKLSGVQYDPQAQSERWDTFISEIMSGDAEKAKFLQKALGYGVSGDTRHECMFLLYGVTTRNGKGTLCESVLKALGDYGCTTRPETISLKSNYSSTNPTEDVARLAGVRFVNISEPGKGLVLNAAQVKSMTGGDSINARFLHENSFDFSPRFKIYINANYLPVVNDMTLFAGGRIMIIPFERHFSETEQDKALKRAFAGQKSQSAIFNWLLEGYRLLQQEGLAQPAAVKAATAAYRRDCDKIALFVDEALTPAPNGEERTSAVYARYQCWCTANGYYCENNRSFKQGLSAIARVERKRPSNGSSETTLLIGYEITGINGSTPH